MPHISRSSLRPTRALTDCSDVSFPPCVNGETAQVGVSPVEHEFFKSHLLLKNMGEQRRT